MVDFDRIPPDDSASIGMMTAETHCIIGSLRITLPVPKQKAQRMMFSYVSLGTRDITRATAFYDAVLAQLGHARIAEYDPDGSSAA
jgi:hypothetical protein